LSVDLQPQPFGKKTLDRIEHPLSCALGANIDVQVVSITAKPVPSSFKLLIQLVQQNIGQQWRQDSLNAKGNFEFVRIVKLRRNKKDVVKRR
jgi:hypothetical protein